MPLLDSFKVDHTKMNAPAVRVAKTMCTPKGDDITIFDLRFCIPNKEILPPKGIHTLEHLWDVEPVFICLSSAHQTNNKSLMLG